MKIGVRKPNIKSRVSARTTGKIKRKVKSSMNPLYGKHGMGMINDPSKAIYNKIYNKTTISVDDLAKTKHKSEKQKDYFTAEEAEDVLVFMEEKLKALKEKARLYKVHSVVGPIIWIIFAFITGMIILPLIIGAMWVVVSLALKKMKQEEIQDHEKEYEEIRKLLSGDIQEININE